MGSKLDEAHALADQLVDLAEQLTEKGEADGTTTLHRVWRAERQEQMLEASHRQTKSSEDELKSRCFQEQCEVEETVEEASQAQSVLLDLRNLRRSDCRSHRSSRRQTRMDV